METSGASPVGVSIVMPAYNAAAFLERAIASVRTQTFVDWQLLVVDDCSTDSTWELVQRLAADDPRIQPLRLPANAGVAAARNAGIAAASGTLVAFLDSDDWWHPRKLEMQVASMRSTGAKISYCSYRRVAEDGRFLSDVLPPPRVSHVDMLKSNHIGNLTGMYDRSIGASVRFRRVGHEDYVFWLELVRCAGAARRVEYDVPLAYYLVRNSSLSGNKLRASGWQWRIYRDIEGLDVFSATRYMLHYAWNALRKRRRYA